MSGLKTHYTASELLAFALDVLPGTRAGLLAKAEREKWSFVEESGRGGKRRAFAPPQAVVEAIQMKAASNYVAATIGAPVSRKVGPANQMSLIETDVVP